MSFLLAIALNALVMKEEILEVDEVHLIEVVDVVVHFVAASVRTEVYF